jgi:membrane-associated protein
MVDLIKYLIEFILHIDKHLVEIVTEYESWTYLILFVIVFCETGLVVTPFLPGDSLLFAAGTVAAMDGSPLSVSVIIILLIIAAFAGDNTNYFIGRFIGHTVYEKDYKLIKKAYLMKTHDFYEKYGRIAIIIARFMPIIRTFAPFVAGVGTMKYVRFYTFSILGNIIWVCSFTLGGYFFGNIPFVKKNFTVVILAIILISLLPPIIAFLKQKFSKAKSK